MSSVRTRDREETKQLLIDAVGTVIEAEGFGCVGVNKVAKAAGVDKALIYRYFGGFSQLLQSYGDQADFWWTVEDILGDDLPDADGDNLAAWLSLIFERHVEFLRLHPVTLEIIAWEMVDRNELTIALEYVREQRSLDLMKQLLARFGQTDRVAMVHFGPVMALLGAAGNYLAARGRHVQNFNGLDLKSDRGWQQLFLAVETMLQGLVQERSS
jgi:AcrR family transcriptional regulator